MAKSPEGLPNTILEVDEDAVKDGALVQEAIDHGVGSFHPDLAFENMVKNYKNAERLYGPTIIRELTGYDPDYVEKNVNIPEFRRNLKEKIQENADRLKEDGVVDKEFMINDKGIRLAAIALMVEELDRMKQEGLGDRIPHEESLYGDKKEYESFSRSRYRDLALKQSIKVAARRGHSELNEVDLRRFSREARGRLSVIYAMDSSGSMRGEKLRMSKKAGVALAYKAIEDRNKVGLIVFNKEVKATIEPCRDFGRLLVELSKARAGMETDLVKALEAAVDLFGHDKQKHLVLLTDALPTRGDDPVKVTLHAVSAARNAGITVSLVGVALDKKGESLAKQIVEVGEGRLYLVKDVSGIDAVILEDYYSVAR
jgi:Mg-chelatase subunit ChlD